MTIVSALQKLCRRQQAALCEDRTLHGTKTVHCQDQDQDWAMKTVHSQDQGQDWAMKTVHSQDQGQDW